MHRKWPDVRKYLVCFQNFTNTHEKLAVIRERAMSKPLTTRRLPGVGGLNIELGRTVCLMRPSPTWLTCPSVCM